MDNRFVTWLIAELNEREWSNSELARRAGMVPSTVSMIVSEQKKPGYEFCIKVAAVFGVSPEYVLWLAGYVSKPSGPLASIPRLQELAERVANLPPERQRRVMEAFLTLLEAEAIVEGSDEDVNEERVLQRAAAGK